MIQRIGMWGAILVTQLVLAVSPGWAQTADLRGVWKLASYTRDGQAVDIEGMLMVTDRYFTRVLMERNRPKFDGFDFRDIDALTPEQRKIVADSYPRFNASAGTYRLDGNVFYFTSTAHHNPGAEGRESDRIFELAGDRLRMYADAGSGNVDERWERVEKF